MSQFAALAGILSQQQASTPAPWQPTDIAGCVLWLDASDAATITDAGAGAVSAWADKSNSGFDVTQGTSTARPTTGTHTINSLNALYFDGGDLLNYSGDTGINVGSVTIFVVYEALADVDFSGIVSIHNSSGNDNDSLSALNLHNPNDNLRFAVERYSSSLNGLSRIAGIPPAPESVWVGRFKSSGVVEAFQNGGTPVSTTRSGSFGTAAGGLIIGGRYQSGAVSALYRLNGDIGEVVVYDTDLSASDMNIVGNYLGDKWGHPWSTVS